MKQYFVSVSYSEVPENEIEQLLDQLIAIKRRNATFSVYDDVEEEDVN